MKTKDIVALVLLGVVLVAVGSILISNLSGAQEQRQAEVEIVQPIDPTFNDQARNILQGKDKNTPAETFSAPVNLRQGLGNSRPFNTQ